MSGLRHWTQHDFVSCLPCYIWTHKLQPAGAHDTKDLHEEKKERLHSQQTSDRELEYQLFSEAPLNRFPAVTVLRPIALTVNAKWASTLNCCWHLIKLADTVRARISDMLKNINQCRSLTQRCIFFCSDWTFSEDHRFKKKNKQTKKHLRTNHDRALDMCNSTERFNTGHCKRRNKRKGGL